MTPEELREAIQIAKETREDSAYSRRVLAKAVLWYHNFSENPENIEAAGRMIFERAVSKCKDPPTLIIQTFDPDEQGRYWAEKCKE